MGGLTLRLASANGHKLAELRRILPGWRIEPTPLRAFPPEVGTTYEENARGKALHGLGALEPGEWSVGEDSGIEAAALGGRPGIASARWADDGVGRLLEELAAAEDRRLRYVCVLVARSAAGAEVVAAGTLEGTAATEPRGEGGFGYDPVFVPAGEELTVAELGDAWKARHSHRARAARALAQRLAPRV